MPQTNLTSLQLSVAQTLRRYRPAVMPGTNAIIDMREQAAWYDVVNACVKGLEVEPPHSLHEFCNIAGVPD